VRFLKEEISFSERRACRAVAMDRKSYRYQRKEKDSKALVSQIRKVAEKHPSYGYRRVHDRLKREGVKLNLKRLRRIYRQERLFLRRKKRRRRFKLEKNPAPERITRVNELWCMDFMFDRMHGGEKLKILTIIDQHSRFCPGIFVRQGFGVRDLTFALDAAILSAGKPDGIKSDNGIEFVHPIMKYWAEARGINLYFSKPGTPVDNAFIESFNGRLRDECLRRNAFEKVEEAEEVLDEWRKFYNEERPHSSLGNLTPLEFMKQLK
jgi:putative transposase